MHTRRYQSVRETKFTTPRHSSLSTYLENTFNTMKLSILLMGTIAFAASMVLAAPRKLNERQNDVPNCVDGGESPVNDTWDGLGESGTHIRSQN